MDNPILEPGKTITGYAFLTYAWVLALSTWGGLVNYLSKIRAGRIARFNVTELIGDMFISGFTGILTFWLCEASGFNELTTAVFVGISGHMGARMIGKIETIMSRKFDLPEDEPATTTTTAIITSTTVPPSPTPQAAKPVQEKDTPGVF